MDSLSPLAQYCQGIPSTAGAAEGSTRSKRGESRPNFALPFADSLILLGGDAARPILAQARWGGGGIPFAYLNRHEDQGGVNVRFAKPVRPNAAPQRQPLPLKQRQNTCMRTGIRFGVLWVVAMATTASANADMFKPSKQDQIKLGKQAATQVRKKEKMLPASDQRVVILRRIAGKLLAANKDAKKQPWEYSFDIVDSKEVNAFALPGGPVFFYTGLIEKLKTEDQLASVLAHEMTHIQKEHWASAYADNQKRRMGITLLLTVLKAGNTVFDIASVSDDLLFSLPYSRKHENEADAVGCDTMVEAGFNPQGMIDVFEVLRQATGKGKPPEFLSTHPDDAGRIKRIQERVAKMKRTFPAERPLPFK
jgi:Zn-dependent protease with chaperone function